MSMLNPYRRLLDLLPSRPLLVGTVTHVGDGQARVVQLGGGVHVVRGEATVNQVVYFRDGMIEGVAPSLTLEEITV